MVRRCSAVLGAFVALGMLATACSSSDSVDASALPKPDAPSIGLAFDATLMNPGADLPTFDDGNGHGAVPAGGRYQIGVRNAQSVVTATLDQSFPPDQVVTASFDTNSSPSDTGFGVVCRMQDDNNYYRLGVGNDGTYAIQRVKDGHTTVLTGGGQWVRSDLIRSSPGLFAVRAECVGDTLTLFESNHQIASVPDAALRGAKAGVFVETFREPNAAIQVDALSVRAFRDRRRITGAAAAGWDALVRAQQVSKRCELLDPKRAGAGAGALLVTRCGSVLFLAADPATNGNRDFDRILRKAGTTLTAVKGLPGCATRAGIRGVLPPPTPSPTSPGGTDDRAAGRVACLDLGGSTAVVWVHDRAGIIGVERVKDGDRAAWKGYGRDWPPFAYEAQPG